MKEYKISKGWAIFMYITAPLLIALFFFLLIMPWIPGSKNEVSSGAYQFLAPVSIGMIALMIAAIADTIKGKFVIGKDSISSTSVFFTRQLKFDEIKGFRVSDKYIFIEPAIENKKAIKISKYFGKVDEIIHWLACNYNDLDIVNASEEKEVILANEAFGWSTEQREEKLYKGQKVAQALNFSGIVITIWTILFPHPYEYAIIVSLLFPVVCIIVLKYFGGLIRVDEKKGTSYPSIGAAILLPAMALSLRALLDYDIFDYAHVWKPAIAITIFYMGLLITFAKEFTFKNAKDYFSITVLSVCIFGYAYGAVVTLNCMYDKSELVIYHAAIVNKRVSSGKTTTYYVELTRWGKQQEQDEVSVSKKLYNSLNKEDTVQVHFMSGRLEIPWFEITK